MRKALALCMSVTAVLFLTVSTASAQKSILGGYKPAKTTEAAVKEAAEFAVSTQADKEEVEMELVSVVKAERQSAAGTNYRLCLKVNSEGGEGQDDVTIFVQAIVHVDLKGNSKLSSWKTSDCGDGEE